MGPDAATWWGGAGLLLFLAATIVFFGGFVFLPVGSALEFWVVVSYRRAQHRARRSGAVVSQ